MVRIDELMINNEIDDFYKDRDRFKGHKLLINFKEINLNFKPAKFNTGKPKMKKKQKASIYIKPNHNKGSLF